MKMSKLNELNDAITKCIMTLAPFEDDFLTEAPDIWQAILMSMSTLSSVSTFMEAVKVHETEEDVEFMNSILKVNGMPPLSGYKLDKYINKERDIDLDKYRPNQTVGGANPNG